MLRGGCSFSGFQGYPLPRLEEESIPEKAIILLRQGISANLSPRVKKGDKVKAGEIIARNDDLLSSPIHASISGEVEEIKTISYQGQEIEAVVIRSDGSWEWKTLQGHSGNWEELSPEKIEELIYLSGASSLDREGVPTRFRSSFISPEDVEEVIIEGLECEPYSISLSFLLEGERLKHFQDGIRILKKILSRARFHIVLEKKRERLAEELQDSLKREVEEIRLIKSRYPWHFEEILIPEILGKEFPYGFSAANLGIIVLSIPTILHIYEAVVMGKPVIEKTIALGGPAFQENLYLRVRIGTPLSRIIESRRAQISSRFFLNSLLRGEEVKEAELPLTREVTSLIGIPEGKERKLLAFMRIGAGVHSYSRSFISSLIPLPKIPDTNLHGEERPCIQCGYCMSVCPVGIYPILIHRYARIGINENLLNLGILRCIDCNLCSYVCPCKIPLAKSLKLIKVKLAQEGCDNWTCILPRFNLKGIEEYKGFKGVR